MRKDIDVEISLMSIIEDWLSKVDEDGYSGGKLRCDLFSSAWCDVDHVTCDKSAICDH